MGTIVKDKSDAVDRHGRVAPTPERPRFGPRFEVLSNNLRTVVDADPHMGPPVGGVDLRHVGYTDLEHWQKFTRIMDLSASITASEQFLLQVMREALSTPLHDVEDQVAALAERLSAAEEENTTLRSSTAELRGQIAGLHEVLIDLERQLRQQRAAPRAGEAAKLPTLTVKPRIRPKRAADERGRARPNGEARP